MSRPVLYCAWFCPFAQKSWIALVHKNVDFEYREQDPYHKSAEWLAINPRGLVPALAVGSDIVIESGVINEYIDEAWSSASVSLLPPLNEPFNRSKARIWMDFVGKKLIPPFYRILQRQDEPGHAEAVDELLDGLKTFASEMDSEGPFFLGQQLSLVDISYIPWALRFYVLKAYRGFELPNEGAEWERFQRWFLACQRHPSVMATVQDEDKLLHSYERYAKNNAGSQVADAINADKPLP